MIYDDYIIMTEEERLKKVLIPNAKKFLDDSLSGNYYHDVHIWSVRLARHSERLCEIKRTRIEGTD